MVGTDCRPVGARRLVSVIVFAPPQPDLALQPREVATMINAFDRPLLAHTEDGLRQVIEGADDGIEGFWFIGHSGPAGIVANNQTLSPAVIGQYLSTAGVQWSYFSSCESAAFVKQLQDVYPHDAYACIVEIADLPAWRTAALIAAKYANVGNIHQAVRAGAPANSTDLRFFPSGVGSGETMGQKELVQVEALSHQLTELKQVLVGDQWHREDGLIDAVRKLKTDTESLRWWLRVNTVGWMINGFAWLIVLAKIGWIW